MARLICGSKLERDQASLPKNQPAKSHHLTSEGFIQVEFMVSIDESFVCAKEISKQQLALKTCKHTQSYAFTKHQNTFPTVRSL